MPTTTVRAHNRKLKNGKIIKVRRHNRGYKGIERKRRSISRKRENIPEISNKEWVRLSNQYPNLIGITDKQIESFLENFPEEENIISQQKLIEVKWDILNPLSALDSFLDEKNNEDIIYSKVERLYLNLVGDKKNKTDSYLKERYLDMNLYSGEEQKVAESCYNNLSKLREEILNLKPSIYKKDTEKIKERLTNMRPLFKEIEKNFEKLNTYFLEEQRKYLISRGVSRKGAIQYLNYIKCFNRNDIADLSKKAFKKWDNKTQTTTKNDRDNPFTLRTAAFVTSPRGGHEILSIFAYVNNLQKLNLPTDFYTEKKIKKQKRYEEHPVKKDYLMVLSSEALPYGDKIEDINDIVYLDDVYMSGEQYGDALLWLKEDLLKDVSPEQRPRLHYMSIVGNESYKSDIATEKKERKWFSNTFGKVYTFPHNFAEKTEKELKELGNKEEIASAVVFPHAIPDGDHHQIARELYAHSETSITAHRK